jgi:VanZ family protein
MILKTFWKPVVWALIIIILSVIPTNEISSHMWTIVPYEDKIMHFIFYGIFSFLLIRALIIYYKKSRPVWLLALATFVIIFLFGMTLELVQAKFTSYRQGDIIDMIANLTGCIFAILIVFIIPYFRISSGAK